MRSTRRDPAPGLIVGVHPVYEALEEGRRAIERIHIHRGSVPEKVRRILERAAERGIPVRREGRALLDRLAGGHPHQGVIAVAGEVATVSLDNLLDATSPLLVVLDGVQDPQNLGAIIRTAETAGVTGVVMAERRSAPLSAAVSRASAGALERVAIARTGNLATAIRTIKSRGVWVVGVDPAGERLWTEYDYTVPVALVFGGEHRGIRRLVRESCDTVVRLPMTGKIESLNVSVAAGIVLFEAVRQRLPTEVPKASSSGGC